MSKEIRVPFDKIRSPQGITRALEEEFKQRGLDLHVHEVEHMDDDEKRQERILKVKNTRYFFT